MMEGKAPQVVLLLVGERQKSPWAEVLREAVADQAVVDVVAEDAAVDSVARRWYDLALIDAGEVLEVPPLVARLRSRRPQLRIVVVTASPTWKRAREALQAGAVDYLRKSLDRQELRARILTALELVPPDCANWEGIGV